MDADTRHQLKTNELGEILERITNLRDPRVQLGIVAIALLIVLFAGYRFMSWRADVATRAGWMTLDTVGSTDPGLGEAPLDTLRRVIAGTSDAALGATARLRLVDGLLARAVAGDTGRLEEAREELESVLASGAPPLLKAAALYQLANLYETRRDFERAREAYQRLLHDPTFAGSPFVALARSRLASLDDLPRQIEFQPGLPPPPPAATQPITIIPAETAPTTQEADDPGDMTPDEDEPGEPPAPDDGDGDEDEGAAAPAPPELP